MPDAPSAAAYEAVPDQFTPGAWCAEAIDFDSEGECYKVIFIGQDSERRAKAYVSQQNATSTTFDVWQRSLERLVLIGASVEDKERAAFEAGRRTGLAISTKLEEMAARSGQVAQSVVS